MTTLTCEPPVTINRTRGGEEDQESLAKIIVTENGFALKFRANRDWLRGMISDPTSNDLDRGDFADKAEAELSVSRRYAMALYRLFSIRNTGAFQDALDQYNDSIMEE